MCTAICFRSKNDEILFGRNMDFSYELDPHIYIVPKNYKWNNYANTYTISNRYKYIATGQDIEGHIFTDGLNEKGLAVAALYFYGYANFDNINKYSKFSIDSTQIVNFLLGNCSNINDVITTVKQINITGVKDAITNSIAPLHWIAVDKYGRCIVIEKTYDSFKIYNNPFGILTNSPDFKWHITNLRNYINLSPTQKASSIWNNIILEPFGQGGGSFGLPGDYTSPSRFVRAAFEKSNILISKNENELIHNCFNIFNNLSIPKGLVKTIKNTYDYTQYTVVFNTANFNYYFCTYYNNQILFSNINDDKNYKFNDDNKIISISKLKIDTKIRHV